MITTETLVCYRDMPIISVLCSCNVLHRGYRRFNQSQSYYYQS